MVSVDKFYVYGGGRWREVDPGSGRIDGWGRARFLVARGGKLEAPRSGPVLAALRALADKKPSAAKEGPPLPYKYPRLESRERAHQCCHHSNSGSVCTSKSHDKKASTAIQCNKVDLTTHKQSDNISKPTQNSTPNEKTFNQKRKRDSTSSEELFHAKGVTVATVHSPRKPEAKRRRISSNTRNECTSSNDTIIIKKSPRLQLRRTLKRKHSSSGESVILESRTNRPKKKRIDGKLRRSARHNISIVISDDDDENSTRKIQYKQRSSTDEPLRPKGPKRTENETVKYGQTESSTDEQVAKRNSKSLKDEQIKHLLKGKSKDKLKLRQNSSSDEPLNKIKQKPGTNEKVLKKPSPKKSIDISSNEAIQSIIFAKQAKLKQGPRSTDEKLNSIRSLRSQNKGINNTQSQNITQDTSKELLIDEKDVYILRLFLEKNFPDEDLLRFDTDDEYKKMHFYRINPLVNVERCPRIARMIRDSQDDRLSLVVFASKLGLRSVSEASSVKRYRTRRRDEKKNYVDIDNIDKENERPSKTSNANKAKAMRKEREDTRERENTKNTAVRKKERDDDKSERDNTEDTATRRKEREDMSERENTKDTAKRRKRTEDDRRERDDTKDTAVRRKEKEDDGRERENNKDTGLKRKERQDIMERENTKETAMSRKEREDKRRERENTKDTAMRTKEREDDRIVRDNTKDTAMRRKEREDMRERDDTKDAEINNDSGKVKVLKKKSKAVSKRPPLNEYSNLEDHAIVSWVSVGARACSVNGNRLWRQLQEQFQRITGHERTWHSLRNRYLRYILPRLGSLALPPSLQTRLRAAAATGELKGKRRDAKRNSIFKPPTRGAASRRPGLLTHQDSVRDEDSGREDNPAPSPLRPRTPRYSDVTRQFAREHRYSSESKSASENIYNNDKYKTRGRDNTRTSAKDALSVSRNSAHRNNSSKSRLQRQSSKSDESSEERTDANKNKSRIKRKHILSLRKRRSDPSDSSQTDRSKSSDSSTGDSDSSDPNPPRRKSDRLRSPSSAGRKSNRINSPGRKSNRINSPETNRGKSNRINSPEPNRRSNRINSPESNRRSNRINSPEPNRRSNRINSPEPNRRSNRINSPESNRRSNRINSPESNRRSNRINSPEPNRRSNRINSPEPNRRSNRINSPEPNRRQSNRINSPETNRRQSNRNKLSLDRRLSDSSDSVPVQINKRKSNRIISPETRHANRIKSPIKRNSGETKIQNSNSLSESRRKDSSDSRRKSSRKAETANLGASSQEKHISDNSKSVKPRTRKLFNPKDIL